MEWNIIWNPLWLLRWRTFAIRGFRPLDFGPQHPTHSQIPQTCITTAAKRAFSRSLENRFIRDDIQDWEGQDQHQSLNQVAGP